MKQVHKEDPRPNFFEGETENLLPMLWSNDDVF